MENSGFIKIYRKILKWEWYGDSHTKDVFFHLLLLARYTECDWRGVHLSVGQAVATLSEIARDCGFSVRNVRTSLKHLESTGEVTVRKMPRFTVFTLSNYSAYNGDDSQSDSQVTGNRQASDSQVTFSYTKKERKKEIKKSTIAQNEEFERFWSAYPKKKSKGDALKAFEKIKPDGETMERILSAISKQKNSDQWKEENGKYIPYPATWLNRMNWEDEEAEPCRIVHLPVKVPKTKEELKEALYE